jgi:hypothetical protein
LIFKQPDIDRIAADKFGILSDWDDNLGYMGVFAETSRETGLFAPYRHDNTAVAAQLELYCFKVFAVFKRMNCASRAS